MRWRTPVELHVQDEPGGSFRVSRFTFGPLKLFAYRHVDTSRFWRWVFFRVYGGCHGQR